MREVTKETMDRYLLPPLSDIIVSYTAQIPYQRELLFYFCLKELLLKTSCLRRQLNFARRKIGRPRYVHSYVIYCEVPQTFWGLSA
jgi:hypothetical protein